MKTAFIIASVGMTVFLVLDLWQADTISYKNYMIEKKNERLREYQDSVERQNRLILACYQEKELLRSQLENVIDKNKTKKSKIVVPSFIPDDVVFQQSYGANSPNIQAGDGSTVVVK